MFLDQEDDPLGSGKVGAKIIFESQDRSPRVGIAQVVETGRKEVGVDDAQLFSGIADVAA
jgi:hypothetical protein